MSGLRSHITAVRVKPCQGGKLLAYFSITVNNDLAVKSIKLIRTDEKEFVAMPQRKKGVDVAHTTTRIARKRLTLVIIDAYERAIRMEPDVNGWIAIDDPIDPDDDEVQRLLDDEPHCQEGGACRNGHDRREPYEVLLGTEEYPRLHPDDEPDDEHGASSSGTNFAQPM